MPCMCTQEECEALQQSDAGNSQAQQADSELAADEVWVPARVTREHALSSVLRDRMLGQRLQSTAMAAHTLLQSAAGAHRFEWPQATLEAQA